MPITKEQIAILTPCKRRHSLPSLIKKGAMSAICFVALSKKTIYTLKRTNHTFAIKKRAISTKKSKSEFPTLAPMCDCSYINKK